MILPFHFDSSAARPPVTGRIVFSAFPGSPIPLANVYSPPLGVALLHTFVAGQKYGVRRDATRRFCFYHLKLKTNPEPGVAPPDGALLFYWPKRVSRKGPRCAGHRRTHNFRDFYWLLCMGNGPMQGASRYCFLDPVANSCIVLSESTYNF